MISKVKKLILKNRSKVRKNEFSKPIVVVSRSNRNILAQVVDFTSMKTVFTYNTNGLEKISKSQKSEEAAVKIANYLSSIKVDSVIFNRNGYKYHGRVKTFAEALRNKGIKI
jgi:large subunit ribosomal protein L18